MAVARAPFIDQFQSLTLAVRKATPDALVCYSLGARTAIGSLFT